MTIKGFDTGSARGFFLVWAVVFFWALSVALTVQLFLLPHVFTAWHAGDGLLNGGDWIRFHALALDLAARIDNEGWQVWELRPEGQAPAGLAAAIYAASGIAKPWTVLPMNAALHGLSAALLFDILRRFTRFPLAAVLGVLPFVMFPSAMTWYAMMHKDSLFIAGNLLFFHGWLAIGWPVHQRGWLERISGVLAVGLGLFFVWIVRAYFLSILQVLGAYLFALLAIAFIVRRTRTPVDHRSVAAGAVALLLAFTGFSSDTTFELGSGPAAQTGFVWQYSPLLPDALEAKVEQLAIARERSRTFYPDADSNLDADVGFRSVGDVLRYTPRALETALLKPYPWIAGTEAAEAQNTMMRRVAGLEMLVVYLGLAGLVLLFARTPHRLPAFALGSAVTLAMLVQALTVANMGSLYRARYGFLLTLVALGIGAIADYVIQKRRRAKTETG